MDYLIPLQFMLHNFVHFKTIRYKKMNIIEGTIECYAAFLESKAVFENDIKMMLQRYNIANTFVKRFQKYFSGMSPQGEMAGCRSAHQVPVMVVPGDDVVNESLCFVVEGK